MKILFLSRWWPFPPNNGSKIRVYQILKHLSKEHIIDLISFHEHNEAVNINEIEFCEEVFPIPYRPFQPGGVRSTLGYFSKKPRSIVDTKNVDFSKKVIELIRANNYGLVILSQMDMLAYRDDIGDHLCFLEELEIGVFTDRVIKNRGIARFRSILTFYKLQNFLKQESKRLAGLSVVSNMEKELVDTKINPLCNVFVIENGVDVICNQQYLGKYPIEPNSIVFAGSLTYSANLEAMSLFTHEVFPLIKKEINSANLYITGNYFGSQIATLNLIEGVHLTGYLDDVHPRIVSSCVSVVPMMTGGGTRLKILESLSLGTPVVSSPKGAEGLDLLGTEGVVITKSPEDMCTKICEILTQNEYRNLLGNKGLEAVANRYSWDHVLSPFNSIL